MKLLLSDWLTALAVVGGMTLACFGLWMAWPPLGVIAAGILLVAMAAGWYFGAEE